MGASGTSGSASSSARTFNFGSFPTGSRSAFRRFFGTSSRANRQSYAMTTDPYGSRCIQDIGWFEYFFEYWPYAFKIWYNGLHLGQRQIFFCMIGMNIGCFLGFKDRIEQERYGGSDCLTMVTYDVPPKRKGEFEELWNDQARLCQRSNGYEWTTMYKSLAFNQTPFSYCCFRMWFGDEQFATVLKNTSAYKHLDKRLTELGVKQKITKFKSIVDDSSGQ